MSTDIFSSIQKEILGCKVVSFDVFDTLIVRDCAKPLSVFEIVETFAIKSGLDCLGFAKKRVLAEKEARRNTSNCEIKLKEIYKVLGDYYSEDLCDSLMQLEISFEYELCTLNNDAYELYKFSINNNKDVIITSDMYLDKEVIESILAKNSICGYKKIYVSSDLMLTKKEGNIFNYISKDLGVQEKDICHIGDNEVSDYTRPKSKGLHAVQVKSIVKSKRNKIFDAVDKNEYSNLQAFINNHIDLNTSELFRLGYEVYGPLLYGFSEWLNSEACKDRIDKLFFLSRDGHLMQEAYKCYGKNTINNEYMYGSRRSLIIPMLWKCNSFSDISKVMHYREFVTIEMLLNMWGINIPDVESIISKYKCDIERKHRFDQLINNNEFLLIFNELLPIIKDNSYKEYELLVEYLKQIDFGGNVGIVDIGWFGNMQKAIQTICTEAGIEANITGYYVGFDCKANPADKGIKIKSFLFGYNKNLDLRQKENKFNSIFEAMFSTNHGSAKKFMKCDGHIEPVLDEFEYKADEFNNIIEFQAGGLKFVKDMSNKICSIIKWEPYISFNNYCEVCLNPSYDEAVFIGELKLKDESVSYIAKSEDVKFYFTHPKAFICDYKCSLWKIGFLKRVFKVNVPYCRILALLSGVKSKICYIKK